MSLSSLSSIQAQLAQLAAATGRPPARLLAVSKTQPASAIAALAAQGCPKVNLQVLAGNAAALAFWRACGFVQDDVVSLGRRLP